MSFRFRPAWLFVPGDRPDRYAKAADRSDVTIIDLEDAVAPADKPVARTALREAVAAETQAALAAQASGEKQKAAVTAAGLVYPAGCLSPERTVIRVNARDTEFFAADAQLLEELPYTHVMLPKTESPADVRALADYQVVAMIETAAGTLRAAEIAAEPNVIALFWGSEDLVAGLGGTSSRGPDGGYRAVATHVRSHSLLAAKAAGKLALDSIWSDIEDLDGLRAEALDAAESGFDAKVSIHPAHVPVVREAFAPTSAQLEWARAVTELAASSQGAFAYQGKMIDAPLLKHAARVLERAGE
ncbi:CoA ester lyase [Brevibacterium sp. 91QC2O2]|uniref:HpcH/HpaI aldolase/citrate lyase family protein n=1 Tax=Brevibacterium TaxID=1696 RepID=UPI00211CE484|nr:CoA ester lyase [Brevibacterium sp. 91QC2O2]MCQ9385391.1 CoA ester lyase [Brevibacterium sp. 68QC2CO]